MAAVVGHGGGEGVVHLQASAELGGLVNAAGSTRAVVDLLQADDIGVEVA